MAGFDLFSLSGATDIKKIELEQAQFQKLESVYPASLHLLANWAIVDKNKVYIEPNLDPTQDTVVPFGSVEMYPWPFRSGVGAMYVDIDPTAMETNSGGGNGLYYCYALEIILNKVETSTSTIVAGKAIGALDYYQGIGAFTMAYNPKAATTANYEAANNNKYPTLNTSTTYSGQQLATVFLSAKLYPVKDTDKLFQLDIKIAKAHSSDSISLAETIYSYVFKANGKFTNPQQPDGNGGISGLITSPSIQLPGNNSSMSIKDLRIILPDEEDNIMSVVDPNFVGEPNELDIRKAVITHYAFDYDSVMDHVVLTNANGNIGVTVDSVYYIMASMQNPNTLLYSTPPQNVGPLSQSVKMQIIIKFNLIDKVVFHKHPDNTGKYVLEVSGGINVRFPGEILKTNDVIGNIFWEYVQTTISTLDGMTINNNFSGRNLKGRMVISTPANAFVLTDTDYSLQVGQIKSKLETEKNNLLSPTAYPKAVRIDFSSISYDTVDETTGNVIPTVADFNSITPDMSDTDATALINTYMSYIVIKLKSDLRKLGVFVSYILYHPDNVYEYNEALFLAGYDSEQYQAFIQSILGGGNDGNPNSGISLTNNLLDIVVINTQAQALRNLAAQNNGIYRIPTALYGKQTNAEKLTSWDFKAKALGSGLGEGGTLTKYGVKIEGTT